jgi:hypothetical protein
MYAVQLWSYVEMESSVRVSRLVDLFVLAFFLSDEIRTKTAVIIEVLFRWQRHAGETAGMSR